VKLLNLNIQAW